MEKKTVLAIVLSMLVLLSWSMLTRRQEPGTQPIENKTVTQIKAPLDIQISDSTFNTLQAEKLVVEGNTIEVLPQRAAIKQVEYPAFKNYIFPVQGFYLDGLSDDFKKTKADSSSLFAYEDSEKLITQDYNFYNPNHTIYLSLKVKNKTSQKLDLSLPFILSRIQKASGEDARFQNQEIVVKTTGQLTRVSPWKNFVSQDPVSFIAYRERYFCAILQPQDVQATAFITKINSSESITGLNLDFEIPENKEFTVNFKLYIGPQEETTLKAAESGWTEILNYGFFTPISKVLLNLLRFLFKIVHNWGVALILLSLIIYLVLFPLSLQQLRSMKEMQAIQPKVEELRKIYKDNPQKLNKEIMELYKEHKVNPFGGCLPLLLQIPVFFALYQALMRSLELKGASFLWIQDLSRPDHLFTLPVNLPILGNQVNILPLLMCVVMFLQQKLTSKSTGVSSEQQKMMLILFPVLFGIIFYHMPSGLVLYWFINSLLMFVGQLKMRK